MAGFTRWVDLPGDRQVELDNGVATKVLVHAHYD